MQCMVPVLGGFLFELNVEGGITASEIPFLTNCGGRNHSQRDFVLHYMRRVDLQPDSLQQKARSIAVG